jgi:hypothetical protein
MAGSFALRIGSSRRKLRLRRTRVRHMTSLYAALKMLHERNELYSFGAGKGTCYLTQQTTLSLVVQAIKEWLTGGEGLSTEDSQVWLDENAQAVLTVEQWKELRETVLAQGRIVKVGQGRGMRYLLPVTLQGSKKGGRS